jgi:hypothetical protein
VLVVGLLSFLQQDLAWNIPLNIVEHLECLLISQDYTTVKDKMFIKRLMDHLLNQMLVETLANRCAAQAMLPEHSQAT